MMKHVDLPILLDGRPLYPTEDRPSLEIAYESGVTVRIPALVTTDLKDLRQGERFMLHDVPMQEIISFLHRVGRFWALENSNHPLYQQAIEYMSALTGYDPKMVQRELNLIHVLTIHGAALYDLLDTELGSRFYLDDWLPRYDALVHAQPWGNAVHVMVGNVPVTSVATVLRSCLTKNRTIAKLSKRDPVTALFFALSMHVIDPEHPVTRSMNMLYWPGGDPVEEQVLDLADVICAWGGAAVMRRVKSLARSGVPVVEFGPKTSLAVVGRESANSRKVAIDLAHDIAIYNQEACFSPQLVFVEGDWRAFAGNLAAALDLYDNLLPRGQLVPDVHAQVNRARLEALYNGNTLVRTPDTRWTVVMIDSLAQINEHPLGRTIYLIPANHISECLDAITPDVQTVVISPWSRSVEIRDQATLRGAAKLTEIGMAEWQRIGMPHDNLFPLHSLVRWVGVERGLDHWGKYIEEGPIDTTRWLMMHKEQLEAHNRESDPAGRKGAHLA